MLLRLKTATPQPGIMPAVRFHHHDTTTAVASSTAIVHQHAHQLTRFRLRSNLGDSCVICFEQLAKDCIISQLPCSCKRFFHSECLLQWLMTTTTKTKSSPYVTCPMCRDKLDPSKIGRQEAATRTICRHRQRDTSKIGRHEDEADEETTTTKRIEKSKRGVGNCVCRALSSTTTMTDTTAKKQLPEDYALCGSEEGAYAMLLKLREVYPKASQTSSTMDGAITSRLDDDYEYDTNKDADGFWGHLEKETFQ